MNRIFYFFFISLLLFTVDGFSQQTDSIFHIKDTLISGSPKDTVILNHIDNARSLDSALNGYDNFSGEKDQFKKLIRQNRFLANDNTPVAVYQKERERVKDDLKFYVLVSIYFFLGIFRIVFGKYFTNMIRVFFNTSLRQSQLTDQLLQDKLPSLLFNLFFVTISGLYIFLLLVHYNLILPEAYNYILFAVAALTVVYLVKTISLYFIGWISGLRKDVENYVFVVFLINKILSIGLLPLITIIAFADNDVKNATILFSYVFIAFMFVLRYLRGFSIIQHSLKISKLHFLIYILAAELLPILLIYRYIVMFLIKSH